MDFMTLLMGFFWAQCYVYKTLIKHTKENKEKLTTCMCSRAHLKSSAISCNVGDPLTLTTAAELNKEADAFY